MTNRGRYELARVGQRARSSNDVSLEVAQTTIGNILTRTGGYLQDVCSHSLQPYRGCTFGNSLCGIGCYVRHNGHVTRGRTWGGFLEARVNSAESYRNNYHREAAWVRSRVPPKASDTTGAAPAGFSIFCSSSTDPIVPQEFRYGVTRRVLEAMCELPPDELILQTHSHHVIRYLSLLRDLSRRCRLRTHVSIETDRDHLPGLPPHASGVEQRLDTCSRLTQAGLAAVVTVSPLLPIDSPDEFFKRIADAASAVVIDHFIGGDGSADGNRTRRTPLPAAMRAVRAESIELTYRDQMVEIAARHLPGRVGVGAAGFAGCFS